MAVDSPVMINGWWVYLRILGYTSGTPTDKQIHNAYRVRAGLMLAGAAAMICKQKKEH